MRIKNKILILLFANLIDIISTYLCYLKLGDEFYELSPLYYLVNNIYLFFILKTLVVLIISFVLISEYKKNKGKEFETNLIDLSLYLISGIFILASILNLITFLTF